MLNYQAVPQSIYSDILAPSMEISRQIAEKERGGGGN
jgi:hypothetical protein